MMESEASSDENGFPRSYDFKRSEESAEKLWNVKKVVETAIDFDPNKPLFSFLEGPPTANAPPGLHHVEMRTIKDLVCRYKFMKGFSVPRKAGWDCHGLPVEVQVEKKLGLNTKKDVVDFGIGKFNALCKKDVFTFITEWDKLTKKMAFWIDLENPYVTLNNNYIESVWWSLKELHNKGLLYEDFKVIPYCPRCETPLSSHEVAQGYKDVNEPAITTMFQLKEDPERYLLAWTTTPWTLPGNVALAVHPDITYAVVEDKDYPHKQFVLAKDLVEKNFQNPVVVEEIQGRDLEGKQYVPLLDYFVDKLDKPAWFVTLANFVTTDEGTGIVHQSPAFGEEDFENCKKHGVAFVQPVSPDGKYTNEVSDYAGVFVKDADKLITERLEKDGMLFSKANYTHSYPFCWRCSTPLLHYALKSWFIAVTKLKEKLIENNEKIDWYPGNIKQGRFGDWLNNLKDWALSRNKFWGTPLPIWTCNSEGCKGQVVIGSVKELIESAVNPPNEDEIDLHKPFIDDIKLKCSECEGEMSRVPYVIDCWYDSGSATFAQFHYPFENKERFEQSFPYDFIAEAIDQTRGWFYTLHAIAGVLFNNLAYKSVVCAGHVVDEKGEKMSKSKGNIINPWEMFDKVGVDSVRLQFCTTSPEAPKRFGYELVRENVLPFLTVLWNSCYFASDIINKTSSSEEAALKPEDKWMISRTNSVVKAVGEALDRHEYHTCMQELKTLVMEDFSRWYIKLIRDRASNPEGDDALRDTFSYVISRVVRLLAPFAPYVSEEIYQNLVKEDPESVHLCAWPEVESIDPGIEEEMKIVQGLVEATLSARDQVQRGLRWPVKRVSIITKDEKVKNAVRNLSAIIKQQTNVVELGLSDEFKDTGVRVKADFSKLGPEFGDLAPRIVAALAMQSQIAITGRIQKEGKFTLNIDGKQVTITKEHLIKESKIPDNYVKSPCQYADIYLDKEVTEEMEIDGYGREFLRRIQQARKEAGLTKDQIVSVTVKLPEELADLNEALNKKVNWMMPKVGASSLEFTTARPENGTFDNELVAKIKDNSIEIFLKK
jgi:isoleucyl-tRNA synthetase